MSNQLKNFNIAAGTLLVAEPFMDDPHFRRAVVLICEYHKEGALGFILNKPVGMNVGRLLNDFPEFKAEIFYGGPVHTDSIHYVHTKGDLIQESTEITNGLYWGGDFEQIKFCIQNELITSHDIKFFVGYSGWGEKQLDEEMELKSWIISEADKNYVFSKSKDSKALWKKVLEDMGEQHSVMAQMPLPNWN
jgi:putative transcriptional regulator